nr:ZU5 and Death domain containing protein [Haemonchus contortus]
MESPEEFEKRIEAEAPKAPESPIPTAEREEYPPVTAFEREEYPIVTKTVTTTTRYEMESPEEFEKRIEAEAPKAPESPIPTAEREEYPIVTETVTTTTRYEMESPEEFEKRIEAEALKAPESPIPTAEREEYPPVTAFEREEYPIVTETVTTTTRYEMESPEEFEKRIEAEAPKAPESPIPTAEREEYPPVTAFEREEYPIVTETVTTTTRYEMESPEEFEKRIEAEVPKAPESPIPTAEREEYPVVSETVTTTTPYEMESPEVYEKRETERLVAPESPVPVAEREEYTTIKETVTTTTRYEMESPEEFEKRIEAEVPKAPESPIPTAEREEYPPVPAVEREEYPIVTETVTTTTRYEMESPEEFEKRIEAEAPKAPESPIPTAEREEYPPVTAFEREEYPIVTETVTTTTRYEMESPEEFEKRIEAEVPKAPESPIPTAEREEYPPVTAFEREEYPIVTETVTTTTRYEMESPEDFEKRIEAEVPKAPESPIPTAEREEYPIHKTFLISFLVDARGGAMRGCRHSGVRIIIPPRKASQPVRVTCRYLRKDKLAHPPPLSEGEELASRILEMAPAGAKFLGPVILEVPHFASLRDREREIVILRSDDGQHWKEHQLEATEDAVQEVLNESFDAEELAQLDDLHTPRITRILTNDFPMYFAVVTRVRQEVHCVGPEGGVIMSSVVPRVQAIFPDGSLTKTIKVSVQAQPVPQEMVTRLHGNRVAVSPIVTVEPRRRKFHKPITLCIPLPQSSNKGMLTQYSGQPGQEPPTLRLLCSITGGSAPAQWEDITGTTQLTFTGDEVSFTTTVSARFWLMDCQTPRDAARMAQEVYNEAICIPYMAKFAVFARRTFPVEGQLRVFCMTDDKEDKTLEKQEHFKLIAKSRDVEVLKGKHQFLEFAGNLVPVTKSGDQLSLYFLPFQENRLAFMVKTRNKDDTEAATEGRIAFMTEPKVRAESLPPQQPICTLAISLPEYTGEAPKITVKKDTTPFEVKYRGVLDKELPDYVHNNVIKGVGADWQRLARALELPHRDIQYIRQHYPGKEITNVLKIWIYLKKEEASPERLDNALRRIGRDDIVRSIAHGEPDSLSYGNGSDSPASKRFDPPKYVDLPPVVTQRTFDSPAVVAHHTIQHEEAMIEHPAKEAISIGSAGYEYTPKLPTAAHVETIVEEPERAKVTVPEEEETVSEVRTVVRTERHVHDTEDGPVVEERTITTTYEDDVAVNEHIVDRTVPLNDEERRKWEELNRLAGHKAYINEEQEEPLPEGMAQEVDTEKYTEPDGTVVTTTTITSHYTSQSPAPISEEDEADEDVVQAQIHHVSSSSRFEAEQWSGEHAEAEPHHPDDTVISTTVAYPSGEEETAPHDENTPIASSAQFERNRSASLAAALQDLDPKGTPQIGFFHPGSAAPLLEAEEFEEGAQVPASETRDAGSEVGAAEVVLSELLLTLQGLKMAAPDRYNDAVNRLKELEEELRQAGAVTPADPQVVDAVARALAVAGADRDVQIRVNQSRHTTTTKTVYETETPGMVGLEPEKIRELHQQMLSSLTSAVPEATPETGTTQKKETAEEGFTNEDGSIVVSKKMTRVVTTTKTTVPGEGEQAPGE